MRVAGASSPLGADDYLRSVRHLQLRHAAALVIAHRGQPARTRKVNDACLALARESRGRFFAVCSVHPGDGATAGKEVDRVARLGACALKLHPNTQAFDVADPSVAKIVDRATQRGLPVLFDAWSPFDPSQPGKFVRLAMSVPDARLILAHAHGPNFADLLVYEVLARYDWWRRNVWIDLSATASLLADGPYAEPFAWVLRKVGTDRLLFGSDYPLDDPGRAVRAVTRLGFTASQLESVFYGNARTLFGLDRDGPGRG